MQRIGPNYVLPMRAICHVVIEHYARPESKIRPREEDGEKKREREMHSLKRSELT